MMIQGNFRAYLIRRSQALRALSDLAVATTKLKELKALFNNFTNCRRVIHDVAERQRFTEKIIVLLLTVDAIEMRERSRCMLPLLCRTLLSLSGVLLRCFVKMLKQ